MMIAARGTDRCARPNSPLVPAQKNQGAGVDVPLLGRRRAPSGWLRHRNGAASCRLVRRNGAAGGD